MSVTQRIFEILDTQKGKSQKGLAKFIGVAPNTVTDWRRLKSSPSIDKIEAIANYLDVSILYLVRGEDEQSPIIPETKKTTPKKRSERRLPEDNDEIPYSSNPRVMKKDTISHEIYAGKNYVGHVDLKVNSQCPICHIESGYELLKFLPAKDENETTTRDWLGIYKCRHCKHIFSVLYKDVTKEQNAYIFNFTGQREFSVVDSHYTPYLSQIPDLPEAFNKPEFAKFRQAYEDLCWAKDYQIEGLVGMAYRRALECLIKDFLISEGYKTEYNNIPKEHLANLLQAMPNEIIKDCGTIVNRISNDYVHYEDDNPEFDISTIKEFFDEVLEKIKDYLIHQKAIQLLDTNSPKLSKNKNKTLKNNSTEILNKIAEENRDLFCEERFIDSTKLYRNFPDEKRECVFAYILGIAMGLNLPLQQILGKDVL